MSTNYQVRFHAFLPTAGQDHNRPCFVETVFGGTPAAPTWKRVNKLILGGNSVFFGLADTDITFGATTRSVNNSAGGWIEFREEGTTKVIRSGAITFCKFDSSGGNSNFMVNFLPGQEVLVLK